MKNNVSIDTILTSMTTLTLFESFTQIFYARICHCFASFFFTFSYTPLLVLFLTYLFKITIFLFKRKCTLSWNFCEFIIYEMALFFNCFLSLSQQLFELKRRMWEFVTNCHIWFFLDEVFIISSTL